ncbi:MAG: hypothetical protein C5B58_03955 [Acidobacteria bacterium]|nr:MAG: hypothetical protein C5B58_03955 [Acidobacteriota bacterium]
MNWATIRLVILVSAALISPGSAQDTELRDLDVSHWFCLNKPAGTATPPDEQERNLMKNREFPRVLPLNVEQLDVASFLKKVAAYDTRLRAQHRADLDRARNQQLLAFENQIVSLTGWLVLAYPGLAESTNCNDGTFHDWHLEVFPQTSDHPPQVDDPTPIICEVTPRTEKPLYGQGVRLLPLAAFIRHSNNSYRPTGHPPRKIRVTGYLMWDDLHNDPKEVGTNVTNIGSDKRDRPWRATAWEIHPILKLETID